MINTQAGRPALTLAQLLDNPALSEWDAIAWSGLASDSRKLVPGNIFVALPGEHVDGRTFIDASIERGAAAVLTHAPLEKKATPAAVPIIVVPQLMQTLSTLAARAYGDPSAALNVIGITGTNGKTTCSALIAQVLNNVGVAAGVVGTLGYGKAYQALQSTGFTTPDAITAQQVLADLYRQKINTVAMEVSSHALAQGRVEAVSFSTAVFTNLSHEHLDYHGDLKTYGKAKARLLKARNLRYAVINRDDPWAKSLLPKAAGLERVLSYSLHSKQADVYFEHIEYTLEGMRGLVSGPAAQGEFFAPLIGDFNASNLLASIATALLNGHELAAILPALAQLAPASGRMQNIALGPEQDIQVVVDYAHTPDALEKALRALRRHTKGNIWCVFGCGGNRDRDKRPLMGRVGENAADHVIVTNDNPRSEDPAVIVSDIVGGMRYPERCLVVHERDHAIDLAVQQAHAGDTVLLAGKGHEQTQIFAHQQLPFSDIQQAHLALHKRCEKLRRMEAQR